MTKLTHLPFINTEIKRIRIQDRSISKRNRKTVTVQVFQTKTNHWIQFIQLTLPWHKNLVKEDIVLRSSLMQDIIGCTICDVAWNFIERSLDCRLVKYNVKNGKNCEISAYVEDDVTFLKFFGGTYRCSLIKTRTICESDKQQFSEKRGTFK